jgi:superfamily I DNA/RNA helicase
MLLLKKRMTMPTINEIRHLEKELELPENAFGDNESERVKVIRYWDNCDVVACPGSGKTTVLLAKLLYLSKKMPFEDGKGICVLTHTNVAIDEIKKRLGSKANILFQHPNFFGTIQSFVDRFLTISAYKYFFKTNILTIDNLIYNQKIKKLFENTFNIKGLSAETSRNAKYFAKANEGFIESYRFAKDIDFESPAFFVKNRKIDFKRPRPNSKNYKDWTIDEKMNISKWFFKFKSRVLSTGILCFDDAYTLAYLYACDFPELSRYFSSLFKFLFVDEMQDTQPHQMDIIDRVFNENVVKQFYGDPDQAIFNGISGGESAWRIDNGERLELSRSKRFRSCVAEVVSKFSEENGKIDGCGCSEEDIKPYLILYKTGEEEQVVDKFKEIVKKHKLHEFKWNKPTSPFKAIGYVGKEDSENLRIQSYFPDYKKARQNKKQYFDNLVSYFQKRPTEEIKEKGTSIYFNLIISATTQMLQLSDCKDKNGKYFTKNMFLKFLNEKDEPLSINFLKNLALWIKQIHESGDDSDIQKIKEDFLEYFKDKIAPLFESFDEKKVKDFVENETIEKVSDIPKVIEENDIEIEVSTVHSVKGETHLATLFLETYNLGRNGKNGCESEKLKCLFCEKEKMKDLSSNKERQKIAYVAMSRPSHLLCVAVNEGHLGCNNCTEEEKKECIWQIENI